MFDGKVAVIKFIHSFILKQTNGDMWVRVDKAKSQTDRHAAVSGSDGGGDVCVEGVLIGRNNIALFGSAADVKQVSTDST